MFYASLLLCGMCVIMFLMQLAAGTDSFDLDVAKVMQEPWRVVTAIFAHAGVAHLLSNLFALALFGIILEARIGSWRTLWLFLISGICINIIVAAFSIYDRSLGASGAIFALLGALVILRPRLAVWVAGMPMPMYLTGVVWALQDTLGVFVPSGTANGAHLLGLGIGLVLGLVWHKQYGDRPERKEKRKGKDSLDHALDEWEEQHLR